MNRFLDLQEDLKYYRKQQNARYVQGKSQRYTYQKDNPVIELEDTVIKVSKSKREKILKKAGWKKANVILTIKNFKGEPLLGHFILIESQAPNVVPQSNGVPIKGGAAIFSDFWIKPVGTLRVIAASTNVGKGGLAPSGVIQYTLPKNNTLRLDVTQRARTVEITATSVREAAKKVGATGSMGVDFEVFSAGGEITGEESTMRGSSISQKYTFRMPTDTFDIKVL
ncbi:MAG: hypothetical protein AAF985_05765 [Bacteroidota bacterium]